MSRRVLLLIIFLSFLSSFGIDASTLGYEHFMSLTMVSFTYLFLSFSAIITGLLYHILKAYEVPVSYGIFCIVFGAVCGAALWFESGMHGVVYSHRNRLLMSGLYYIYMPLILYATAFMVDTHAFLKALPQILLISIPGSMVSAAVMGAMMKLVIDYEWQYIEAFLFGLTVTGIYPMDVLDLLKESGVQTKYVTSLLQGESVLSTIIAITGYNICTSLLSKWVTHWYQPVLRLVRIFVMGIPVSYVASSICCALMKLSYNSAFLLFLLTISSCYTCYVTVEICADAGYLGTIFAGFMMGTERASLTKEVQESVWNFWSMVTCMINGILYVLIGVCAIMFLSSNVYFKDYILVFVTYLVANISRFLAYFLCSPILSRTGYGMSFQNMIICVWCGLKSPLCMCLVMNLFSGDELIQHFNIEIFFLHSMSLVVLMLLINSTFIAILLRALGLSEISVSRQLNMKSCLNYINDARQRTIGILKMDRFLSDANWPLVLSTTNMKHPYKTKKMHKLDEEEEDDLFLGYRYTYCADCKKNVLNEPTPKEMAEMTREAKLRVLKLKKTVYSREYENGMISREGLRSLLQAVEIAVDTKEAVIEVEGLLKLFDKEAKFHKRLQNLLQHTLQIKAEVYKPPKKKWRFWCYRIVHRSAFCVFMIIVIFANLAYYLAEIVLDFKKDLDKHFFIFVNGFFLVIYLVECVLKIFSFSVVHLVEGFRTYFSSLWQFLEIVVLGLTFGGCVKIFLHFDEYNILQIIASVLLVLRLIKLMMQLRVFQVLKPVSLQTLKHLEQNVSKHKAIAFELGKNYIAAEEEILENLPQIVDNDKIKALIREQITHDRLAISIRLGLSQKERPWVASTVKTKIAIRTVLNSMRDDVYDLKISGWVDDLEHNKLLASLVERYKCTNSLKFIDPSPPKILFKDVSFMGYDKKLTDFLFKNVSTRKYDPGHAVLEQGEVADGIYILITGVLQVSYIPNETVVHLLKELGVLPVVEDICYNIYEEPAYDYLIPGNTIGELSVVTGRNYDGIVIAETHSEVFFLSTGVIKKAAELDSDPINGFECRIWKSIAFKRASEILMAAPFYRSYTKDKIMYLLQQSFVPDLSNYKVFVIGDMIQDVVLIEGVVVDYNTRDVYVAPCYIPRAVQRLIFPVSSLTQIQSNVQTKLLIVPSKDKDEYEIMLNEEYISELLDENWHKNIKILLQQRAISSIKIQKNLTIKEPKKSMYVHQTESVKGKISFAKGTSDPKAGRKD